MYFATTKKKFKFNEYTETVKNMESHKMLN